MALPEPHGSSPASIEQAPSAIVARQPILDRSERVVGFEILYRATSPSMPTALENPEAASSSVIVRTIADIGLQQLVGDRPAYINVTRDLLLHVRPLPLPPDRVVLELIEGQVVDRALVDVLEELVDAGFQIALDDFRWRPELDGLVGLASIVKLDIRAMDESDLRDHVARLRGRGIRLIAEKVETREEYEMCRGLGFDAFQGYFFAMPDLGSGRSAPTHKLAALATLADPAAQASFEELERVILRDAGLSHKLVRLVNSAFVGVRREIGTVREALTLLGTVAVHRWAMLLVLAELTDRPSHLLAAALHRARLAELLAGERELLAGERELLAGERGIAVPDRAFTVGLFSVVDALLGAPLPELLDELPFDERTRRALLDHDGPEGRLLSDVLAFERGEFEACDERGLYLQTFAGAYRDALDWAGEALGQLG